MTTDEAWDLWLKQLRDPSAKKAIRQLESAKTGGRCCLGHACFVLLPPQSRETNQYDEVLYDGYKALFPPSLAKLLNVTRGVKFVHPIVISKDGDEVEVISITGINDGTDYTLFQIADILEEQRAKRNLKEFDETEVV